MAEPTLNATEALAFVLYSIGELQIAHDHYQTCMLGYQRLFGPDDPATLRAAGGLAHVMGQLGKSTAAIDIFRKTLTIQEKRLGHMHASTRATRINFANLLLQNGGLDEAETLISQIAGTLSTNDFDHPTALRGYQLLAFFLEKSGDKRTATLLYDEILGRRERVLGRFHPDTLLTLNNLAVVIGDAGKIDEALSLLSTRLNDPGFPLGEHPTHLRLRHNLGHFSILAGRAKDAETVLGCVMEARTRVLGPNSADTLRTIWTYAEALEDLGHEDDAERVYTEVLERAETFLGPDHGDTRLYRRVLGQTD